MKKLLIISFALIISAFTVFKIFESQRFHKNLISNKVHFKLNKTGFTALGEKLRSEPDINYADYCPYEGCVETPSDGSSEERAAREEADRTFASTLKGLNYQGRVFFLRDESGKVIIPNIESYRRSNYGVFAEWEFWPDGAPELPSCNNSPASKLQMECSEKLSDFWTLNYVWYDNTREE